ncbi:MAG: Nif3-like dinuclear metal center hexameric protein [Ferruginibacter sp.]
MKIQDITHFLETIAPLSLQESYDNAGLITGNGLWECSGVLTTLDATEAIVEEAKANQCNLIVAHHPIVFGGLKKINGKNYVERAVIAAIKADIAIYAIHTNLDNVFDGVSGKMATLLGLNDCRILEPKNNILKKLITFVPKEQAEIVRTALFAAGAGHIGNYSECSFNVLGEGTFNGNASTQPFVGTPGVIHTEAEIKIETLYPIWLETKIVQALKAVHPYEEVAYDLVALTNQHQAIGSGIIGKLENPISEAETLALISEKFNQKHIRHTPLTGKKVQQIAVCGGAGSFLIKKALSAGADFYVTADVKYHEFFDAENQMVVADIGHYESEQFTIELIFDVLREKFPNFAVLKTRLNTNPVQYFQA